MVTSTRTSAIETWLELLSTLPNGQQEEPGSASEGSRVLFILDNDFGELTTVLYLVLGQQTFRNARILVSPRLYDSNHDALPGRLDVWHSAEELTAVLGCFEPRVVVFASAYLLPVHGLLSAEQLGELCEQARRLGALVVTADPFLGLISQWSSRGLQELISIDIPKDASHELVALKKMGDALLHSALGAAEKVLRTVPHLYPSFTDMSGLEPAEGDQRNLCFFNNALLLPPGLAAAGADPRSGDLGAGDDIPHWMFLISLVDYQSRSMFVGSLEFARTVAHLLAQTARLGRRAIFLGPSELIDLIRLVQPADDRIQLLSFCSFRRAMSLLLTAEYSFYWNLVSHSILMQLWNGRPVILLDPGHLVRAIPEIYPRILAWYYQGWEPPFLDPQADLSLASLQEAVGPHASRREDIMARFRRAPSPTELLDALVGHRLPATRQSSATSTPRPAGLQLSDPP